MRNRSGQIDLEAAALGDLKAEQARLVVRMGLAATRDQEKAFFARLLELDEVMERRFDLPRPQRKMRARR